MVKKKMYMLLALSAMVCGQVGVLCGAGVDPHAGHSHGDERAVPMTIWTERFEVFLEHPYVVAGEAAAFVTHVTELASFGPRKEGVVTFVLEQGQKKIEHAEAKPARDGIYIAELTFPTAGTWSVALKIAQDGQEYSIKLSPVKVYGGHEEADHAPDAVEPAGFSFLKEQQWVTAFKVETAKQVDVDGGVHYVVADSAIVSVGDKRYVFVQVGGETFEQREVEVEGYASSKAVVRGGLSAGDHVVTKGTGTVAFAAVSQGAGSVAGHGQVVSPTAEQVRQFNISVETAQAGGVNAWLAAPGEIKVNVDRMVHVVPRVAGVVQAVKADLGEVVKAGRELAVLESRGLADAKAAYLAAGQHRDLAKGSFDREKALYDQKVSSEQEYLTAKEAFAKAEIAWRTARQKLLTYGLSVTELDNLASEPEETFTMYRMAAPFGGTVITKHLVLGEVVDETSEAFVIADLSSVWVDLAVNQRDISGVRKSQVVDISLGSGQLNVRGKVSYVDPVLDTKTRTGLVRIELDNSSGRYRPGQFVSGRIQVSEAGEGIVIATDSVQLIKDETCVFVKCGSDFELRHVAVGRASNGTVEILSGLAAGEEVVTGNAFHLKAELEKQAAGDQGGHGHAH